MLASSPTCNNRLNMLVGGDANNSKAIHLSAHTKGCPTRQPFFIQSTCCFTALLLNRCKYCWQYKTVINFESRISTNDCIFERVTHGIVEAAHFNGIVTKAYTQQRSKGLQKFNDECKLCLLLFKIHC